MVMLNKTLAFTVVALFAAPGLVHAQSDSDDNTATVTVNAPTVSVTGVQTLDFGSHFALDGVINSSDQGAFAEWSVDANGAVEFQIDFTLPAVLDDGSGNSVPITFGTTSARALSDEGNQAVFDPNVGLASFNTSDTSPPGNPDPHIDVFLGEDFNGDGSGDVTVDLTGAPAGTYNGTITMTMTVI